MAAVIYLFLVTYFFNAETSAKCSSTVNGKEVCGNKDIFTDEFNDISSDRWTNEIRLSEYPDYEFNYYNKTDKSAYVRDGILYIKPVLAGSALGGLANDFIFKGSIELNRYPPEPPFCTRPPETKSCYTRGQNGFRIIPPVMSARLISTTRFRFGSIKIRAKMPVGDWIYPQIELIPTRNRYGKNSGKIMIAMSRGNVDLQRPLGRGQSDFGTSLLEAGVIIGPYNPLRTSTIVSKTIDEGWHEKFHDYRLDWKPGDHSSDVSFSFYVDNRLIGQKIKPPIVGFLPWAENPIAPFDEEMVVALGVGVGGIRRFPDNVVNKGQPKPWKNLSPKGMYNFWNAQKQWLPTWSGENVALQIDSVKITGIGS